MAQITEQSATAIPGGVHVFLPKGIGGVGTRRQRKMAALIRNKEKRCKVKK